MINLLKTTVQVYEFIEILESLSDELFKAHENFEVELKNRLPVSLADYVLDDLARMSVDKTNALQLQHYIKNLCTILAHKPVLKLVLAVRPPQDIIDEIYAWACNNVNPNVLLDFDQDPKLLAGATVVYKGKYKNCTYGHKILAALAEVKDA